MTGPDWKGLAKSVENLLVKRGPELLTGFGIAGMITTVVLAVRATPKAIRLLEARKERDGVRKLTPIETVKTAGVCYIPSVVTGTLSVACLIGATTVSGRRNAALATAYSLSETALNEYRDKVTEAVGEKKERTIREAVAKERLERDPVSNREVLITGKGTTLCYDSITGRYFESDMERIKRAENEINQRMRTEMYISLNDFYYEIGLPPVTIGDDLGWNIDRDALEIFFSTHIADDGRPCLVLEYRVVPDYNYH